MGRQFRHTLMKGTDGRKHSERKLWSLPRTVFEQFLQRMELQSRVL